MVLTVLQENFYVNHWERSEWSLVHNVVESFFTRRDEFVWNDTTLDLVHKTEDLIFALFSLWSQLTKFTGNFCKLTRTTGLLLMGVLKTSFPTNGLTVVNLRSTDVHFSFIFAL